MPANAVIPQPEVKTQEATTTKTEEARPAWLPEKFKSPEDLVKSYGELEKKIGQPAETKTAEAPATSAQTIELDKYREEFEKTGTLSEASLKSLEASGIKRDVAQGYVQYVKQSTTQIDLSSVGGQEGFDAIANWAKANLSKEEIDVYNEALRSPGSKFALDNLKAKFEAAVGSEPALLGGSKAAPGNVFRSTAELTAAIGDPRYAKDPAYRQDVQEKLARSNL